MCTLCLGQVEVTSFPNFGTFNLLALSVNEVVYIVELPLKVLRFFGHFLHQVEQLGLKMGEITPHQEQHEECCENFQLRSRTKFIQSQRQNTHIIAVNVLGQCICGMIKIVNYFPVPGTDEVHWWDPNLLSHDDYVPEAGQNMNGG